MIGLAASQVAASRPRLSVGGLGASAVLPYLAVPVTVTALRRRFREGAALLGVTAATLLVSAALTEVGGGRQLGQPGYLAVCAQWLILAGARPLRRRRPAPGDAGPRRGQAPAVRRGDPAADPAAQRRPAASRRHPRPGRHLRAPAGGAAHGHPADRGAVLSASGGGRLVVLAQVGVDRVDWETPWTPTRRSPTPGPASSRRPRPGRSRAPTGGGDVSALVVPLVAGVRTVGLVALEADRPAPTRRRWSPG